MRGDKLSRETSPGGDNRDTPIGGVSRLSRRSPIGDVPVPHSYPGTGCLTVLETLSLHEGEPAHWWTSARDEEAGGGLIASHGPSARTPV